MTAQMQLMNESVFQRWLGKIDQLETNEAIMMALAQEVNVHRRQQTASAPEYSAPFLLSSKKWRVIVCRDEVLCNICFGANRLLWSYIDYWGFLQNWCAAKFARHTFPLSFFFFLSFLIFLPSSPGSPFSSSWGSFISCKQFIFSSKIFVWWLSFCSSIP